MSTVPYRKRHQTFDDLYQHLKNRGLLISNKDEVSAFIQKVGFHRFKIYCAPFRDHQSKQFYAHTHFATVQNLYGFDEALRMQMFAWIQYIEIGIRSFFNETMLKHSQNPFWYLDATLFANPNTLIQTLPKIRSGFESAKDATCAHYRDKYHNDFCPWYPDLPPAWMAFEYMTLGNLAELMNLVSDETVKNWKLNRDTNRILGISKYRKLCNWMLIIRDLRNTCYHHSRLFSRNLPAADGVKFLFHNQAHFASLKHHNRLYTALVVVQYLMMKLGYKHICIGKVINQLFADFDISDNIKQSMGFPYDWQNEFLYHGNIEA